MTKIQENLKRNKCSLFPHERIDFLSLQEASQQIGWNVTALDVPDAWRVTGAGEDVKIAVLDTGCDLDHPDLKSNLLPGKNFVKPGKSPDDDHGHGTHCCGIICAENNDLGMVGVAPKSKVIPIKVLDKNGNGNLLNVARGVRFAVDAGADIITMSLGAPRPVQQVRKAIQYAASKGVPVFVAAGNSGFTKEVFYPAAYPETIAIGSIDEDFDRSNFSNTGKNLDFLAPGGEIFSTVPDDWYAVIRGTSQACPWASGIAALVLSYVRKNNIDVSLETVEDYRSIFRKHTIPITNKKLANKKFYEGFGILDPKKLALYIQNTGLKDDPKSKRIVKKRKNR